MKEREGIQRQCLDLLLSLEQKGYPVCAARTNAGKVKTYDGYWVELCREGWADITCLIAGSTYLLETKTKTGTKRESQKKMKELIEKCGGKYVFIRDIKVLRDILESGLGIDLKEVYK